MNAINTLTRDKLIHVTFLEGHQEADSLQLLDFSSALSTGFAVSRVNSNMLLTNPDSIRVLIEANPLSKFEERDKLILDQYLMKGGRMIWLVDPVKVSLDSLSEGMTTLALPADLNLSDKLYHYGVRLNNDLIQDAECLQIRVNTAPVGPRPTIHWLHGIFHLCFIPCSRIPSEKCQSGLRRIHQFD